MASRPPTTKNTNPYMIYIKPSFLWSTVTSQEWMWSKIVFPGRCDGGRGYRADYFVSFRCAIHLSVVEVVDHLIQLGFAEIHCGHQHSRFELVG